MWQRDVHIAIWELRCQKNRGEDTVGKNSIEVIINKKVYQLSGSESEEYLQKLARYIDRKMQELSQTAGYDKMSLEYQNLMLSLNLADEYFKCREELEQMDKEATERERQLFETKHEMIDATIQCETLQKMVSEYKEEIIKLQKELLKLEQRTTDE